MIAFFPIDTVYPLDFYSGKLVIILVYMIKLSSNRMNSFFKVLSATVYLFATLVAAAEVATVSITASNAEQESSLVDSLYTTIAPNNLQAFNRATSNKHVKLNDKSCFVESETYTLTEDLSFGFFVEQKLDGSYGIRWYYEKKKFFSFDLLKVKFRHNSDFFNNIFHSTIFDGFFYSWFTESWDSILAQTFEISVKVEEKEVIYSTSCDDRKNCIPLQIPSSAPCSEKSSTLITKSGIPKTSSEFGVSYTGHESLSITKTQQNEDPTSTLSSFASSYSVPMQTSKNAETYAESDSLKTQESSRSTGDNSEKTSHSQTIHKLSTISASSSSVATSTSNDDSSKATDVLLTFSVSTTSFSSDSRKSSTSSMTSTSQPSSQQSYYPIEFDCPTQVPTMFPITDNTVLGYYIEAIGNSKYRIDWFFTFPADFKISDYNAFFKHGNGKKFNILAEKWENGFFYSYTADSWNELVNHGWDFELEGFFSSRQNESQSHFTTIFLSSNCGSQAACNPISFPETPSEVSCSAATEVLQTSTTKASSSLFLTTVTKTISGLITSYTTYCPDTATGASSSSEITVITDTVSGTMTSYTTYCPDTATSVVSSSEITAITDNVSGTMTSYTTYCPDTNTDSSSSSKITIITDTVSGTMTSYTTYCPDTATSVVSSSEITAITDTVSGTMTSYTTYCPDTNTDTRISSKITIITDTVSGTMTSYITYCPDEASSETSISTLTSAAITSKFANVTISEVLESVTSNISPSSKSNAEEGHTLKPSDTTSSVTCLDCQTDKAPNFGEMPSQSILAHHSADVSATSIPTQNTIVSSYISKESSIVTSASSSTSSSTSSEIPLSVTNGASKSVISSSILFTILSYFILF